MTSRNLSSPNSPTLSSPHAYLYPIIITPAGGLQGVREISKESRSSSPSLQKSPPPARDQIFIPPTPPPSPGYCPSKYAEFSAQTHLTSHPAQFGPQVASESIRDAPSDGDEDSDEDSEDSYEDDESSDGDSASAYQEPPPPPPVERLENMSISQYSLPSRRTPSPIPTISYPEEDRTSRWVRSQQGSDRASAAGRHSPRQDEGYRKFEDTRSFHGAPQHDRYAAGYLNVPIFPVMPTPPIPGDSRQLKSPYLSPDNRRPLRRPSPASSRTSRSSNKLGSVAPTEMYWFD